MLSRAWQGSRHSVYLRELEPQIAYPIDDAVKRRLIVDPASKSRLVRTGSGHLETFERSHHTYAESPAHDYFVFSPLLGFGLSPTGGPTLLRHICNGVTVARKSGTTLEPTQRVLVTTMTTLLAAVVMVHS